MPSPVPPSPADTDRNLLFGVIALQGAYIDNGQFADVCSAWTTQKHKPLADLLVERGWLRDGDRQEVERTVERHAKRHGGDLRKSLGAVADAGVRDAIRGLDDAEIRRSLSSLPPAAGYVLVATVNPPTEQRSRYSLTRLHGEGGLGRVWVAHDQDLNRDVALKEIRPDQARHPEAWRRFLKEAQVTGQLEHPNIVPVYEAARRPEDDQPFYTMRLVRGQTLADAISAYHERRRAGKEDPLDRPRLLQAFVSVCQAIGYAHSRGVIHRDLKPDNVVLGGFGEVIVLDWGLAKMMDQPDDGMPEIEGVAVTGEARTDATQAGRALGTPAYMAPEQAEGRLDLIDGRTDVYGLGSILFEILAGRPPHLGTDTAELLRHIIHGETPQARAAELSVPRALDAVCTKAMAKDRRERYAQATDLAEEVHRWLADEPVSAWREPWPVRVRRWLGRHRSLVTATAAAVVVAIIALTTGILLLTDAYGREREARGQAEQNEQKADAAAQAERTAKEVVEKREMEVSQARADLEETLARSLLRPLGHSAEKITDPEIEALWELTASNDRVRLLFVEQALQRPMTTQQLQNRSDMALHAAVTLDPARRQRVEEMLLARLRDPKCDSGVRLNCVFIGLDLGECSQEFAHVATRLALEAMGKTTDSNDLRFLAEVIATLAVRLDAAEAVARVREATRLLLLTMGKTTNPVIDLQRLGKAVVALAARLDAKEAAAQAWEATRLVLLEMERRLKFELSEFYSLRSLLQALAVLATRLDSRAAGEATRRVLEAIGKRTDSFPHETVTEAVSALATRLDSTEAGIAARLALELIGKTTKPPVRRFLGESIAVVATRLDSRAAGEATRRVLEVLGSSTTNDLGSLGMEEAIPVLAARLDAKEAAEATPLVLLAMGRTTNGSTLQHLAAAAATLAGRLEAKQAGEATRLVLVVMGKTTDSVAFLYLGKVVAALAVRLDAREAAAQAGEAIRLVLLSMGKTTDHRDLRCLGEAVAVLGARLDAKEAAARAGEAAHVVLLAVGKTTDGFALQHLGKAVAALAPRLDAREAGEATRQVLLAMGKTNDSIALSVLGEAIAALAARLDAKVATVEAGEAARLILLAMGKDTHTDAPLYLGKAIAALAARLDAREAGEVTRKVLLAMGKTDYLSVLGEAIAALAARLDAKVATAEAGEAAGLILLAMGKTANDVTLQSLEEALVALTVALGSAEVSHRAWSLTAALGSLSVSSTFLAGLAPLAQAARPLPGRFSDQQLVNFIKMPICQALARDGLVKQLGHQCGQNFATLWDFVAWARVHRPDLDLTSPPVRPAGR